MKNKKGFTLVEIIIVLTIIAILAVIAILAFRSQLFKGRDAQRKADLDRIKIAIEEYEKDHNCYPSTAADPTIILCKPGTGLQPYLDKIPCDPETSASYYYEYDTSNPSCPGWYRIYTSLDSTTDLSILPACGGPSNNSFNYYVSSPNAPACSSIAVGSDGTGGDGTGGGASPTPNPTGVGFGNYYGCMGGVCDPISWDPARPGPVCDPNFQNSSCYGRCGPITNECKPWR